MLTPPKSWENPCNQKLKPYSYEALACLGKRRRDKPNLASPLPQKEFHIFSIIVKLEKLNDDKKMFYILQNLVSFLWIGISILHIDPDPGGRPCGSELFILDPDNKFGSGGFWIRNTLIVDLSFPIAEVRCGRSEWCVGSWEQETRGL